MLIRSLSEKNYRLYFVYILIFALIAASSLVCLNVMRQYVNDETIRTIRAMEEISLSKDVFFEKRKETEIVYNFN